MVDISEIKVEGWERVVRGVDPDAGLHGIVAVHDTTLGPALGGLRMWPYASEDEALVDVMRLSRGMTYKSALAQTGLGGGKAVIIGNASTDKSPALFHAMGKLIDSLGGKYITAEDVGIGIEDLDHVRETTKWVSGLSIENGGSGNPSPYTAHGTFVGLKACLEEVWGSADFSGKTFAVQGIGAVAKPLCEAIRKEGGVVVAADVNEKNLQWVRDHLDGTEIVEPNSIYDVDCDVFVPCALGAVLNDATIPRLKAKAVGGCANNQLGEERHAAMLQEKEILYAPDYVINAGGIINVSCEFEPGGYQESSAMPKIENIYHALKEVFAKAREDGITTSEAADRVAERRISEGQKVRE
ncbi:MAG: Glu/Leu/Phe/Val dehydrogenase dimerization domain-containing protein [Planctomycetota bacterium JB042]